MWCLQVDLFVYYWCGNLYVVFGGQFEYLFEWFVLGMYGQVEGVVVDWQQLVFVKILVSLEGLLWVYVYVWLMFVVGVGFQYGQIEWFVVVVDFGEIIEVIVVFVEEQFQFGVFDYLGILQCMVFIMQFMV